MSWYLIIINPVHINFYLKYQGGYIALYKSIISSPNLH